MQEFNIRDGDCKIPLEESLPGCDGSFIGNAKDNQIFRTEHIKGMNKRDGLPILILFEPENSSST
jgi:hypothetical protein